jgi:hypothetical protein
MQTNRCCRVVHPRRGSTLMEQDWPEANYVARVQGHALRHNSGPCETHERYYA